MPNVKRNSIELTSSGSVVREATTAATSVTMASVVENVLALCRQKGTDGPRGVEASWAEYPALLTASWMASAGADPSTRMVALPIETSAASTPSTDSTTFATVAAQAAQSIPPTRNLTSSLSRASPTGGSRSSVFMRRPGPKSYGRHQPVGCRQASACRAPSSRPCGKWLDQLIEAGGGGGRPACPDG